MKITIPTAEELSGRLGGLDKLLTAKRWERAAIVYAFTRDAQGERTDLTQNGGKFPVAVDEFARLGFSGLAKRDSVARYRHTWQRAVDEGHATPTEPGQDVVLPDLPWPGTTQVADNPLRARRDDAPERKVQVIENILADPDVARAYEESHPVTSEAVTKAIQSDPAAYRAARAAVSEESQRNDRILSAHNAAEAARRRDAARRDMEPVHIDVYADRMARAVHRLLDSEYHQLATSLDELLKFRDHISPRSAQHLARELAALTARAEAFRGRLNHDQPEAPGRGPNLDVLDVEFDEKEIVS